MHKIHLEYVGKKPVIDHKGVDLSLGKEDKYIYVEPATQILIFLEKLQSDMSVNIETKKVLDEDECLQLLHHYRTDFEEKHDHSIREYEKKIEEEISNVKEHTNLSEVEQEVLANNLKLMKGYRLQRATNKLIYEEIINICVEVIMEKNIKEISMPLSMPFVHVAESLESSLALICKASVAKVEVMLDKGEPYTKLTIEGFCPDL